MGGYLTPFWPLIALMLALSFTSIALGVIPAFITKNIINKTLPPHANFPLLVHFVELLAGIFLVKTLMSAASSYLHGLVSNGIVQDLRIDLFHRILQRPPSASGQGRERLSTRVINDVGIASTSFSVFGWRAPAMSGVVGFLDMTLAFINNGWTLAVTISAMLILNWHFTLVFLIAIPPFFLLTHLVGRVLYTLNQQEYGNMAELNGAMLRSVGWVGAAWARLWGQEVRQREHFRQANRKISETSIASRIIGNAHHMSYTFPVAIATVFIWFYGAIKVMHGTMSLGTLIAFAALLTKNTYTVSNFMDALVEFPHLRGVLDRIFALWPSTEGVRWAFWRRRQASTNRPSLWHWLRDLGVRFSAPPRLKVGSLRRLLGFMVPYWPYSLLVLFDAIIGVGGLALIVPLFQRTIIDTAIPQHNVKLLGFSVFMIALFPFVHLFSAELSSTGHEFWGHRSLQRLREWAYDKIQAITPAALPETNPSRLMGRLLNDINALYSAYAEISHLITAFLPIVPSIALITVLSWRLGLLIVFITLLFIPLLQWGGKLFYGINRTIFEQVEDLNGLVLETLDPNRLAELQLTHQADQVEQRFSAQNQRLADLGLTSSVLRGWFGDLFGLHYTLITVVLWLVGGMMIIHRQLLLGTLVAIMAYAGKVEAFGGVFGVYLITRTMQANADRVFAVIDELPPTHAPSVRVSHPDPTNMAALAVKGLRVGNSEREYDWVQPAHTLYVVQAASDDGPPLMEILVGLRNPLQGTIERSPKVVLISAHAPLPTVSPQELLTVAQGRLLTLDGVRKVLQEVGITTLAPDQPLPDALGDDLHRRMALTQALVGNPDLVIADCHDVGGWPLRHYLPRTTITLIRSAVQAGVTADVIVIPHPVVSTHVAES
ncbi:MAG: ABC transporter ATP-binding protein [Firmicutes bacterium]|nr:ABC transporter ATP-binding protein [Bacillota bacterium]